MQAAELWAGGGSPEPRAPCRPPRGAPATRHGRSRLQRASCGDRACTRPSALRTAAASRGGSPGRRFGDSSCGSQPAQLPDLTRQHEVEMFACPHLALWLDHTGVWREGAGSWVQILTADRL